MKILAPFAWLTLLGQYLPTAATGQEQLQEESKARLFDSFEWKYSEDTGARLDNFAFQLQNHPELDGYIICYGPEGAGHLTKASSGLALSLSLIMWLWLSAYANRRHQMRLWRKLCE